MFLFLRLVLGHFIGDFLLQFNKIYELKHKGIKGGIPHALLITFSFIFMSWPYLRLGELWFFIAILGIIHLIQDSIKVSFGKIKYSFWLYILDQLFHIGTISLVFFTGLKDLKAPAETNLFLNLYNNNSFIIYLIAIIFATYNGFYLIRSFNLSFFRRRRAVNASFEKWHGMLERGLIVTFFALGGRWILYILLILAFRLATLYLRRKHVISRARMVIAREATLSWIIGIATGFIFYTLR